MNVNRSAWRILLLTALLAGLAARGAQGQPVHAETDSIALINPVFDGWFRNKDGSFSLSFGYFSRQTREPVDIPLGQDNVIEPSSFDGRQPTYFLPQPQDRGAGRGVRHWGVFVVTVPADFGDRTVVWTLRSGNQTASVPGRISHPNYQIDALGRAGLTPPGIAFDAAGARWRGPAGTTVGPVTTRIGEWLPLTVWATDDNAPPVVLHWFKHQGPGLVNFSSREVQMNQDADNSTIFAAFDRPGSYVLRVRATNRGTEFDRYCCWTNGYLFVQVLPE